MSKVPELWQGEKRNEARETERKGEGGRVILTGVLYDDRMRKKDCVQAMQLNNRSIRMQFVRMGNGDEYKKNENEEKRIYI